MSAGRNNSMNEGAEGARTPFSKKMQLSQQELDRRAGRQIAAGMRAGQERAAQEEYVKSYVDKRTEENKKNPIDPLARSKVEMAKQKAKSKIQQRKLQTKTITTEKGKQVEVSVEVEKPKPTKKVKEERAAKQGKVTRKVPKKNLAKQYRESQG